MPQGRKELIMIIGLKMKYFVLNPTKKDAHGHASRQAMRTYADCIEKENPELAEDLRQWASNEETEVTA
jgi:hypothetical protein